MVIPAVCVLFGLLVGSFLNVVIYRVPRHESLVSPGSHCPSCGHELGALELVPVVSWLALRARCRACGAHISARYPLVELLTAGLWGAMGVRFADSWGLPAYLALTASLVALSGIDLDTRTLPRQVIYVSAAIGGVLLVAGALVEREPERIGWAALGGAIGVVALGAIHLAVPHGMGLGDVRLAGLLGLHLGWLSIGHVPLGLFLGFVFGAVVGVAMIAVGRAGRRTALPFGPFLAAGTIVAVLWGDPLLDLWLQRS
jgi:leader peptidase (prepilin peptidase)/N-methyltransferase